MIINSLIYLSTSNHLNEIQVNVNEKYFTSQINKLRKSICDMKIYILFSVFVLASLPICGQPDPDDHSQKLHGRLKYCDSRVEQADSSINYRLEPTSGLYVPVFVLINNYDKNGNLISVTKKDLPDRNNVYNQIFTYDEHDNLVRYLLQLWDGNKWVDNLINERTYTSEGLIESEVFLRENSEGIFSPYQRHFYVNENDRPITYLRQIKNADGTWYDFSEHFYVYDELGRLTKLYGKYVNRDLVYWERTSFYNPENQIIERYFRQLKYDPVVRENVLMNIQFQKYNYNIYGDIDEVYNHDWIGQSWVHTNKDVAYYSILKGKKVNICHNGHEICVAAEAVKAHLEHGDKLGTCPVPASEKNMPDFGNKAEPMKTPAFSLFPNPVKDKIRLTMNSDGYDRCLILSQNGLLMKSIIIKGMCELEMDVSRLRPGLYFIKTTGPYGEHSEIMMKE